MFSFDKFETQFTKTRVKATEKVSVKFCQTFYACDACGNEQL
jgi:hypothetical protein